MTFDCWRLDALLDEVARGHADGALEQAALQHADGCERCARRLADRRTLSGALRELSVATATPGPPPRLELELRAALRRREESERPQPRAGRRSGAAWVPLAAAAALAALATLGHRSDSPRSVRRMPGPQAQEPVEAVAEFLPLAGARDPLELEGGQIVRLRLPQAALASLGWPVSGDQGTVTAEVVLGRDGMAHAIRLVR